MGQVLLKDTSSQLTNKEKNLSSSWTKTVESGAFIRTKYRKGNKTKTETKKFTKNKKKVVLGYVGEFECYVYPFEYPDTVFLGKYPVSIQLDSANVNQLFIVYNRAKWFLEGNAFIEDGYRKAPNIRRRHIQSAYNQGLSELRKEK